MSKTTYHQAVGRRKTAVARVRLTEATKTSITVNDKTFQAYFPILALRQVVEAPFLISKTAAKFTITAKLTGGGISSQAMALAHGLARALVAYDAELKPAIKTAKLLTRDARMKERRKFGLKKARKAPQWSKR
ncbi:MAG: 30S ribosomal protein S9 [Patescibacteria group bacterium]|nr:30S ribosomal protein S9 [Patescibacteria group bacterium]